MKRVIAGILITLGLTGCAVLPPDRPAYFIPSGVTYVAPTYPSPGYGYVWIYSRRHGWIWHHRHHGYHHGHGRHRP